MLLSLQIKNFILIDDLNLDFQQGFYAITGETGSGKSILLDSLLFVLGDKFDLEVIKSGNEMASVVAEFTTSDIINDLLLESGINIDKHNVIIKRQQFLGGKKKFFINNEPVTAKLLNHISNELLEIHGQHSHSILLDPLSHLKILDNFANLNNELRDLSNKFKAFKECECEINRLENNQLSLCKEIDFLKHTIDELSNKAPKKGEEEELANLRIELQNKSKNQELLGNLNSVIEKGAILPKIASMIRSIEKQNNNDNLIPILESLNIAYSALADAEAHIYKLSSENESLNLDDIETRLFEIRALARKYNLPSDELMPYCNKSQQELEHLENQISNLDTLKKNLETLYKDFIAASEAISQKRKKAAIELENLIQKELAYLKMENCAWKVDITTKNIGQYNSEGIDIVRFYASTNPGMPAGPIDKIASGGELSRLILALKVILFDQGAKATIIFDEIDIGIGGSVADAIGERLKKLSNIAQVIVITHQPQVASNADFHILVTKKIIDKYTSSSATILDMEGRKREIARMISGQNITAIGLNAAEELIKK